jgi:glycosyltransferase involved in cell wall biosynthesis
MLELKVFLSKIKKTIDRFYYQKFFGFYKKKSFQYCLELPSYESARNQLKQHRKHSEIEKWKQKNIKETVYDCTIIVAAYNTENYIAECIDSLINQSTNYHYMIKIINDGSTDNTGAILEKYSLLENVIVAQCENGGVSKARNRGLDTINSEYIMFVDSDDKLPPYCLQKMLDYARSNDLDIVECSYQMFDGRKFISGFQHKTEIIERGVRPGELYGYPWGKIFKSELFHRANFEEGYLFEDTINSFIIYPTAKRIGTLEDILYDYRRNRKGIMHSTHTNMSVLDTYFIAERLLERIAIENINIDESYLYTAYIRQIVNSYERIYRLGNKMNEAIFILFRNLMINKFEGVTLLDHMYSDLEKALMQGNYKLYLLLLKSGHY